MNTMSIISMIIVVLAIAAFVFLYYIIEEHKRSNNKKKEAKRKEAKRKIATIDYYLIFLRNVKDLNDIFLIHKDLWKSGIRYENFGPSKFGMFRTDDINTMKKDQVYLGGIYGLSTKTLEYWEGCNDKECIQIVRNQYRDHLIINLKGLVNRYKLINN